ncbi:MAG TPA: hypothetical protein VIE91_03740 [Methylophilaceae bacterium]
MIADIRLALAQSQPLGSNQFSDTMCAAAGPERTQSRRGRPANKTEIVNKPNMQPDFGF